MILLTYFDWFWFGNDFHYCWITYLNSIHHMSLKSKEKEKSLIIFLYFKVNK